MAGRAVIIGVSIGASVTTNDQPGVLSAISAVLMLLGAGLIGATGVAHAAAPVTLGGGSGLVVNGDTLCTLTAIGSDRSGNLTGFTSAHCGGPGAVVASEAEQDAGIVGTMVAGNDVLDYAVIKFDPAKVRPVNEINGFRIDGIGPDPTFGEVACKLGRTTGYSCGVTWGPGQQPGTIVNQACAAG